MRGLKHAAPARKDPPGVLAAGVGAEYLVVEVRVILQPLEARFPNEEEVALRHAAERVTVVVRAAAVAGEVDVDRDRLRLRAAVMANDVHPRHRMGQWVGPFLGAGADAELARAGLDDARGISGRAAVLGSVPRDLRGRQSCAYKDCRDREQNVCRAVSPDHSLPFLGVRQFVAASPT